MLVYRALLRLVCIFYDFLYVKLSTTGVNPYTMPRAYKPSGARQNRKYSEVNLKKAVRDVINNKLSLREASEKYGVPIMTISDHKRGKHTGKYGGQTVLNDAEEEKLSKVLQLCADWGQPLKKIDIQLVVQGYLNRLGKREKRFKNNCPGKEWIISFLKRHKELTVKMCENIKRARAGVTRETIKEYFDELEATLDGVPPENIINYDETNYCDDPGNAKVVVKRGVKHARRVLDSSKSSTSVMVAATASGHVFPPYTVYRAKYLYDTWVEGGLEGARYNTSQSGWFDQKTFEDWFMTVIVPYAKKSTGDLVVIGDNLSSHFSDEVIELCLKYHIRFVMLPANSTHICQPLDISFFRPSKIAWRQVLEDWKRKNRGVLPKSEFPRLLKQSFEKIGVVKLSSNVIAGFKAAGIVPFNPQAVLKNLPQEPEGINEEEIDNSWTSSIIDHLKSMSTPENKSSGKKKRISGVKPGRSVTLNQLVGQVMVDEPECDEEVGNGSQDPDNPDPVSEEIASHSDDNLSTSSAAPPPMRGDFIMVDFKTREDEKNRLFLGEILEIFDPNQEDDDGPTLRVKFLRKRKGKKETYFVFPNIDDIEDISFEQVVQVVKCGSQRRGMLFFSGFDDEKVG